MGARTLSQAARFLQSRELIPSPAVPQAEAALEADHPLRVPRPTTLSNRHRHQVEELLRCPWGWVAIFLWKGKAMDKDRVKGSAQQAKGTVKEVAGKVTGDAKLQSEGKADKAAGKIRNAIGGLKDSLRGK
jgi:uncharacterized protein YjbJ (UPF0337 family)